MKGKVFAGHNRKPQEELYVSVGRQAQEIRWCQFKNSARVPSGKAAIWADDETIEIYDYEWILGELREAFQEYSGEEFLVLDVPGLDVLEGDDIPETEEELIEYYNRCIRESYVDRDSASGCSVIDLNTGRTIVQGGVNFVFRSNVSPYIIDAIVTLMQNNEVKVTYKDSAVRKIADALANFPEIEKLEDLAVEIVDGDGVPEQFVEAAARAARSVGENDYAIVIENN